MNKDEPETALEYLKKVKDTMGKVESSEKIKEVGKEIIDPNYKTSLFYNLACCYQRLGMLEDCIEFLEKATLTLDKKIVQIEDEENSLLFNNTDTNSLEGDMLNNMT